MQKHFYFLLFLTTCLKVQAQSEHIKLLFTPDTTVVERVFPSIGWDARFSFINGNSVDFKGPRVGVRFGKKRHRLTVGYRWFSFEENIETFDYKTIINPRYFNQVEGYYYNLTYQHIFIDKYRYAIGSSFDIGLGASYDNEFSYRKNLNVFKKNDKFIPVQLGIYGEWKATRFVGINATIGYRYAYNYTLQPSINNVYLDFGTRFYVGSMVRYLLNWRQVAITRKSDKL